MKIMIVGAAGMLGSALYEVYKSNHTVYGIDRDIVNKDNHITADITDYSKIETAIKNIRPNIIINCAAMINVNNCEIEKDMTYLINTKAAGNMAYLAQKYNSRIIFISTSMVFDGKSNRAYTEEQTQNPANYYAQTKLYGELETEKYCKNHIIIRTNIMGWKPGSFGHWLYDSITTQKPIKLYSDLYFNCLYVKDMIKPIENMFTAPVGVYHITSRDNMSKYEYGKLMMKTLGEYNLINKHVGKVKYKNHNKDKVKRPYKAVLNCDKYEKMYWKLPTMKESLQRFMKDCPYYWGPSDGMR